MQHEPDGRLKLVGENTDWLGILNCVRLSKTNNRITAIMLGAGGAAQAAIFALQKVGIPRIVLFDDQSQERDEELKADFPSIQLINSSSLPDANLPAADIIVSCVPADNVSRTDRLTTVFAERGE
jgi:pentafunctional AROM polypeptide